MKLPRGSFGDLRAAFADAGYEFRDVAHAAWQARGDTVATLYKSGKLVLQGRAVDVWVLAAEELGGTVVKRSGGGAGPSTSRSPSSVGARPEGSGPFAGALAKLPEPRPASWIGIDEAGKGDYFGPLVVAAARVEDKDLALLAELGVGDSKRISDKKVHGIAKDIAQVVPHHVLVLMPERYNDLYERIGNLNRLLAWAHATVAENLLESGTSAELILSDQFSKADLISSRLKERGKQCRFFQRTKAEDDPAVGAASIFARSAFLRGLERLESANGVALAKGAGAPVVAAGHTLVADHGPAVLGRVAKLHFKTTRTLV